MTKGELISKLKDCSKIDTAIPLDIANDIKKNGGNPREYVTDYRNNIFGRVRKLSDLIKEG